MSYCSYDNSFLNLIDENKLFSFITTFTFLVIGIFLYILRTYTFFEKRRIPRAVRPTVPFGNIKDVLFQKTTLYVYLWKYYNRFKRKGCKFGGLYLFFKPSLLIVDPILMNKILSQEKSFIDVYKRIPVQNYKKILNLFKDEILEQFLKNYNNVKTTLTKNINEEGVCAEMHNFFMETTCLAFGFKSSLSVLELINNMLEEKCSSSLSYYLRLVYPIFGRHKSSEDKEIFLKNIIQYRKKNDIRKKDLIQGFADLVDVNNNCSMKEIATEMFDIFVYNIIHSYSITLFSLYELASNEDIQEDLIGEIRRFNKDNKSVNLNNVDNLKYLDAVVRETLRKYPPVPMFFKKCKEDFKNTEYGLDIPKGTLIFGTIFGVQHDPANFIDPENFDPDRFLDENRKYIKPNTYNPFGHDLRKNIGLGFTTIHVKLGLISILSSFKITLTNSHYKLEFDNKNLQVHPKEPLPIRFDPLN